MAEKSKSELVYKDLCQLYTDINQTRRNPKLFRQAFETYVFKSQQLTEAMRNEYHQKTGLTWIASNFNGWDIYTNALKKIRNAAAHGHPIELDEAVISIYEYVPFKIDLNRSVGKAIRNKYRAIVKRSCISDLFSEKFSLLGDGYTRKNKVTNCTSAKENYAFPIKNFAYYELRWSVLEVDTLFDNNGNIVDVVKLVLKSFPILVSYMRFFRLETEKNIHDCYKPDYWTKHPNGIGWTINPKYLNKPATSFSKHLKDDLKDFMRVEDYIYVAQ